MAAERASRPAAETDGATWAIYYWAKIKEIIAEDRIMSGGQPGATRNPLTPAQEPGRSGARAPLPPIPAIERVSAAISEDGVVAGPARHTTRFPGGQPSWAQARDEPGITVCELSPR